VTITSTALARFVRDTPADAVTARDVEAVDRSCFDTAGAALAGLRDPAGRVVADHVRERGGNPQARPLGCGWRTSATGAALLGGAAARALDLDDVGAFGAAGATLLPALLALAEWSGRCAGRCLVEAYAIGYTVGAALAAGHRERERGYDPTSGFGVVAAAAAGARLLRLDLDRTRWALGIAASHAGGLGCNTATGAGVLHSGLAAAAAVRAVQLAARGVTAAPDAVEQRRGLRETLAGAGAAVHGRPPEAIAVADTLTPRRYPCHPDAHGPVAALLELVRAHRLTPAEVVEIRVAGLRPDSPVLRHPAPVDGRTARTSLRHLLAVALCRGRVEPADLTDEATRDPAVAAVADRVWLEVLPHWDPRVMYGGGHGTGGGPVRVVLADGRELTHPTAGPGAPGGPVPEAVLVERFQSRVAPVLAPSAVDRAVPAWRRLSAVVDVRHSLRVLADGSDGPPSGPARDRSA
jgi:2-methylcitrate dehydratase PrpD